MDKCSSHKPEQVTHAQDHSAAFKKEAAAQTDNQDWAAVKAKSLTKQDAMKDFGDVELYDGKGKGGGKHTSDNGVKADSDVKQDLVYQMKDKSDKKLPVDHGKGGDKADQEFEK